MGNGKVLIVIYKIYNNLGFQIYTSPIFIILIHQLTSFILNLLNTIIHYSQIQSISHLLSSYFIILYSQIQSISHLSLSQFINPNQSPSNYQAESLNLSLMSHQPSATGPQYKEQFNKELAKQLKLVREAQPNHIPVFAMKYKNASKYLIQDLKQPLALFPKKYPLSSVYDMIVKQSEQFCNQKLKSNPTFIKQGPNFKLPQFYLYTISMIKPDDQKSETDKMQEKSFQSQKMKPIGRFVRLDLEMSFEQGFEKYGRENVLTVVYTDATEMNSQYNKRAAQIQKWLTRVIVFILILVLIPFLMKNQSQNMATRIDSEVQSRLNKRNSQNKIENTDFEESLSLENKLEIDVVDSEVLSFREQRTINYDEESI